jgi:hypothetical protein
VSNRHYEGQLEDLKVNQMTFGLFNFESAGRRTVFPASARDQLKDRTDAMGENN